MSKSKEQWYVMEGKQQVAGPYKSEGRAAYTRLWEEQARGKGLTIVKVDDDA